MCGVCGVCVVWCVARLGTQKKPPCVGSKRLRVYRHHAHMCYHMRAWCRYTRGRDVLNLHTEVFGTNTRRRGERGGRGMGVTDNSAYHETAHVELSLVPKGHRKQPNVLAHLKFQSR